jgi:hypothetical protein
LIDEWVDLGPLQPQNRHDCGVARVKYLHLPP